MGGSPLSGSAAGDAADAADHLWSNRKAVGAVGLVVLSLRACKLWLRNKRPSPVRSDHVAIDHGSGQHQSQAPRQHGNRTRSGPERLDRRRANVLLLHGRAHRLRFAPTS